MRMAARKRIVELPRPRRARLATAGAAAMALLLVDAAHGQSPATSEALTAPDPAAQVAAAEVRKDHPLAPAIAMARASRKSLEDVSDYDCTFIKRERMGDGQLLTQTMQLKVREKPFGIYMKFVDPNPDREVLFVHGQNQNNILVRESGVKSLVGAVSIAVDSPRARAENRHPITDLGMRRLIDKLIAQWTKETEFAGVEVRYYPDAKIGGIACPAIECGHPRPYRQFPFHVTRLYIDAKSNLPVRLENYDFPTQPNQQAPLVEEYTYVKLRTNLGLTDQDFSPENPAYRFR
jgi:hypothetical protein